MEKLRQLLNDYEDYKEKETGYSNYDWRLNEINDEEGHEQWITAAFRVDDSQLCVEESIAVIICKGYMFINWLVENEKIDIDAYKKVYSGDLDKRKTLVESRDGEEIYQVTEHGVYESLLMLLAIQDDPISFLVFLLKPVGD